MAAMSMKASFQTLLWTRPGAGWRPFTEQSFCITRLCHFNDAAVANAVVEQAAL